MATIDRIIPPCPEDAEAIDVWPGVADVNAQGVALAVNMLKELESEDDIAEGVRERDLCELKDWPRHGTPFRNIVAEYLKRAREVGPEVEEGLCAVLTDMIATVYDGCVMRTENAAWYARLYPAAAEVSNGE